MSDPIFAKLLSNAVYPTRNVEWFGLAEQIINTVYALGEQPGQFCDELVKRLAQRVWNNPRSSKSTDTGSANVSQNASTPAPAADPDAMDEDLPDGTQISSQPLTQAGISTAPPRAQSDDAADAFELSQLLFVVGHVAIKQIAFLELVEREWKRQKEAKTAGSCSVS